jgi:uncharacterized protein (TIGR00296 family)
MLSHSNYAKISKITALYLVIDNKKRVIAEASSNKLDYSKLNEGQQLCAYCFETLIDYLTNGNKPKPSSFIPNVRFPLFVTWFKGTQQDLRGCIGTFQSEPLSKNLGKYSLISALRDDRFPPIGLGEVPELKVGVSILTDFEDIKDPLTDWEVGTHGVEINIRIRGRNLNATFLPEVAEEEKWTNSETLDELMMKAGYSGSYAKAL